jgi:methionyl-tRNA formyltransferase
MPSDPPGRVLLVGLGPTAHSALQGLLPAHDVVGLVRDGDDETTRLAADVGVEVLSSTSLVGLRSAVQRLEPDCVVISSYRRVVPGDLVMACRWLNVHYAELPRLRGRATVNWALINGDPHTAITIHEVVPGLDQGNVLFQETVAIPERATVTDLYETLNAIQRQELGGVVSRFLGGFRGTVQDEANASYGATRLPCDGAIDWTSPTASIDRLVRALTHPFPGAYTWIGLDRLFVDLAEPATGRWEGRVPGRVVAIDRESGGVEVLTGDGVLKLLMVHRADGPSLPASAVITSLNTTMGLQLQDVLERMAALEALLVGDRTGQQEAGR